MEVTAIGIELNAKNQEQIVETVDGHLILVIDNAPDIYYGCYYYNNGEFPYAIKDDLEFVLLNDGKERCLTKIKERGLQRCKPRSRSNTNSN